MTVWIKQGAIGDLQPVMRKCVGRIAKLYDSLGKHLYITSMRDSDHSPGSLHYDGLAVDIKRKSVAKDEITKAVGIGFDVVEYDFDKGDIFHIEYDPKTKDR